MYIPKHIYMHLHVHPDTYVDLCTLVQYMWLNSSYGYKRVKSNCSPVLWVLRQCFQFPTTASGPDVPALPTSTGYQWIGGPCLREECLCRYPYPDRLPPSLGIGYMVSEAISIQLQRSNGSVLGLFSHLPTFVHALGHLLKADCP